MHKVGGGPVLHNFRFSVVCYQLDTQLSYLKRTQRPDPK